MCVGCDNVAEYFCLLKVNTEPTNNKNFSLKVKGKKQQQKVCFSTFNTSDTPVRINSYRKRKLSQGNIVSMARMTVGADLKFSFSKVKLMTNKTSLTTKSSVRKIRVPVSSTQTTPPSNADSIHKVSNPIIITISCGIISIAFFSIIKLLRNILISSREAGQDKDSHDKVQEKTVKVDGGDVVPNDQL